MSDDMDKVEDSVQESASAPVPEIFVACVAVPLSNFWSDYPEQMKIRWCKGLRLLTEPRAPVALASYPGSGNHWLRYLLQQATGIMTGSTSNDHEFLKFLPGEDFMDGRVLVVKTHQTTPVVNQWFQSAILLIRDPKDAVLADFHRIFMGHTRTLPKSAFKLKHYHGKVWRSLASWLIVRWWDWHSKWLREYPGPVHVVLYSKLVRDTRGQLRKILRFLDHPVTEEDLDCALGRGDGFARRNRHKNFEPFTPEMYALLNEAVKNVSNNILLRLLAAGETVDNDSQWLFHVT